MNRSTRKTRRRTKRPFEALGKAVHRESNHRAVPRDFRLQLMDRMQTVPPPKSFSDTEDFTTRLTVLARAILQTSWPLGNPRSANGTTGRCNQYHPLGPNAFGTQPIHSPIPDADAIKTAAQILDRFRSQWHVNRLFGLLADPPNFSRQVSQLAEEFDQQFQLQLRNAILGENYLQSLNQFMKYVFYPHRPPKVEFAAAEAGPFRAYTDGKRIYLPGRVDVDDSPDNLELNRIILFSLAFHEAQHWGIFGARSTFEFSFHHPEGALLLQRLLPRSKMFHEGKRQWKGSEVLQKILKEEGLEDRELDPIMSHLEAMAQFAQFPGMVMWLFNFFEDLRLKLQAEKTGMAEFMEITERLTVLASPHPALLDPQQMFWFALTDWLRDQNSSLSILQQYGPALKTARTLFERYRQSPFSELSPERSATYAWDVYEALEQSKSTDSWALWKLSAGLKRLQPADDITEIMTRRRIMGLQRHDRSEAGTRFGLPRKEESRGEGFTLDEFNFYRDVVERDVVSVKHRDFRPRDKALPRFSIPAYRGIDFRTFKSHSNQMIRGRRLADQGDQFAMDVIPGFLAELSVGNQPRQIIFEHNRQPGNKLRISVVIDLSASMQYLRKDLPATPIQMAANVVERLVDDCRYADVPLEIWGVHGFGQKTVTMYRVAPPQLQHLQPIAVGDARLGAAVRFLTHPNYSRSRNTNQSFRKSETQHLILLLTDGTPGYLRAGHDELIESIAKRPCAECTAKKRRGDGCRAEPNEHLVDSDDGWSTYEYANYEYADIAHAMETSPGDTKVHYIELTGRPLNALLRRHFGRNWQTSTGTIDLSRVLKTEVTHQALNQGVNT